MITYLSGDPTVEGAWQEEVGRHDAAVNLAGAPIFMKWTDQHKKLIMDSRVRTTRNLAAAIPPAKEKSFTLISASAIGYYGFHDDEDILEGAPQGNDFLAGVAAAWEAEAMQAARKGARVAITRFGIVLGPAGGALGQMVPLFKWFLGGPIGSGRQWFSWIHLEDLARALLFVLDRPGLTGPVNLCAPGPVTNSDLARALGKVLHRPSFMPAPGFAVRMVLGEFGSMILKGQKVLPRRLLDEGFTFQHPEIVAALQDVLGRH